MKLLKPVFGALATLAVLASCAAAPSNAPIVVSGIPFDDSQNVAESYALFMDLVAEATGREVEFYQATDYATVTEGVISGQVDIAQLSAFSYVLATGRTDQLEILGISGRNSYDPPGYYSYGIKQAGNGAITTLSDLKGKKVCFSDPSSGAGYLWPAKFLYESGLNPDPALTQDFTPVFVDTFPQVALSVQSGDCAAGFLLDVFWDKTLVTSELVDLSQLEQFWTSTVSPGIPLVANTSKFTAQELESLRNMIQTKANKDSLVEIGLCQDLGNCNFLSAAAWGYVAGTDDFYDELRDLCSILDLRECKGE